MGKGIKAQSMSLNVIIIAAIALIVLVILIFIFTGRMRGFGTGLEDCKSKGGQCTGYLETKTCPDPAKEAPILNTNCEKDSNTICCVPVFG